MVKKHLKISKTILIWFILTAVWNIAAPYVVFPVVGRISNISSYSYSLLILFWAFSLKKEIPDPFVLLRLRLGGFLLVLLFVSRFIRWNFSDGLPVFDRLCWYTYYIPNIIVPVLSLSIARHIKTGRGFGKKTESVLAALCILLVGIVMTNDFHSLLLSIEYEGEKAHSTPGILYFIILAWYVIFTAASYVIMLVKSRVRVPGSSRFLPVVIASFAGLMLIAYMANMSSSPKIAGVALYNIQEVQTLQFLGFWETCILAGLVPSVSMIREREWIREGVLGSVREESVRLREIFDGMWRLDEEHFRESLLTMSCLGAYIKRRANLELITDAAGYLDVTELKLAIRESLDYYSLAGITAGFEETGRARVPALLLDAAYEIFEETVSKTESACYVKVSTNEIEDMTVFRMEIEADADINVDGEKTGLSDPGFIRLLGAELEKSKTDETMKLILRAQYPSKPDPLYALRFIGRKQKPATYGLSGLTKFLSLEEEGLAEKIRIHDSLGRCLLITKRYILKPDSVTRHALFTEWSRTLSWMDTEDKDVDVIPGRRTEGNLKDRFIRRGAELGIDVSFTGVLPEDRDRLEIVDTAVTVHITNILKHTDDNEAFIEGRFIDDRYELVLSGAKREVTPAAETGGLKNLRTLVESAGGTMTVNWSPRFSIQIMI